MPLLEMRAKIKQTEQSAEHETDDRIAKSWEAFLDKPESNSNITPQESAEGTVVKRVAPTRPALNKGPSRAQMKTKTMIDPRTSRPTEVAVNEENRQIQEQFNADRKVVRKNFLKLRKLQEKHQKILDELKAKKKEEIENFKQRYARAQKQQEKQRAESEQALISKYQGEIDALQAKQKTHFAQMQSNLQKDDKLKKKQFEEKQKQELKDFETAQKDKLKKLKEGRKADKKLPTSERKKMDKDDKDHFKLEQLRYEHHQAICKLRDAHTNELTTFNTLMAEKKKMLKEMQRLKFGQQKQINQAKSDTLLSLQESSRELEFQIRDLELKQLIQVIVFGLNDISANWCLDF